MKSGHHLALSLSRELWNEMLQAALPVKLAGEAFSLRSTARQAVKKLGIRRRVAGLLEDGETPEVVLRARDRAREVWIRRKPWIYRRINELIRVEGHWRVDLDHIGTELIYGDQKISADAYLRGVAEGTVFLLRENIELPFVIERRVGASVALGDIRYDAGHRAVIGSIQDLGVHIGDNAVLQLLSRLAEYGLEQQLPRVNPIPILKRDQVEEMVKPMGGPLKMQMGVEDLELEINSEEMTLRVRFGFTRAQITDKDLPEQPPL
jgi:hypothetical protein